MIFNHCVLLVLTRTTLLFTVLIIFQTPLSRKTDWIASNAVRHSSESSESFHEECFSLRILRLLMNPVNWPLVKQFIKNSHTTLFLHPANFHYWHKKPTFHRFSGIWYTLMGASFTFEDNIDKDLLHTRGREKTKESLGKNSRQR